MKIFLDGPNLKQIKVIKNVNGYTFNPSLFKKLGAKNYLQFVNQIKKITKKKICPLRSLEMIINHALIKQLKYQKLIAI